MTAGQRGRRLLGEGRGYEAELQAEGRGEGVAHIYATLYIIPEMPRDVSGRILCPSSSLYHRVGVPGFPFPFLMWEMPTQTGLRGTQILRELGVVLAPPTPQEEHGTQWSSRGAAAERLDVHPWLRLSWLGDLGEVSTTVNTVCFFIYDLKMIPASNPEVCCEDNLAHIGPLPSPWSVRSVHERVAASVTTAVPTFPSLFPFFLS